MRKDIPPSTHAVDTCLRGCQHRGMDVRRRTTVTPPIARPAESAPVVEPPPTSSGAIAAPSDGRLFPGAELLRTQAHASAQMQTNSGGATGIERIFEKKIG